MPRLRRLLPLLALLALAVPSAAHANSHMVSTMSDDGHLLLDGPAVRNATLDEMKALGVDQIRTLLIWRRVADEKTYSAWDDLVDGARARGMSVQMDISGPMPKSASQCKHAPKRPGAPFPPISVCAPNVAQFQQFVKATARHFGRRVDSWSLWNEPNLDVWLLPRTAHARSGTYLFDARRYRDLYRAGARGLAQAGHGRDQLLLGETAPVKSFQAVGPVDFLQSMFCLDGRNRPLTGSKARDRGCNHFSALPASGFAVHPYTPALACTPLCKGGSRDITLASLSRLYTILDAATRYHRLARGAARRIYISEFGFQSNPPNAGGPISLEKQARYLNWSEAIAYHDPRVQAFNQYLLADDGDVYFNTGLKLLSGKKKASYNAWQTPLYVSRIRRGVNLFGGVRPGGAHNVTIRAAFKRGGFTTIRRVRTNGQGYLSLNIRTTRTRFQIVSGDYQSRIATP